MSTPTAPRPPHAVHHRSARHPYAWWAAGFYWTAIVSLWVVQRRVTQGTWADGLVSGLYDAGLWLLTSIAGLLVVWRVPAFRRPASTQVWIVRTVGLAAALVAARTVVVQLIEWLTPLPGFTGSWPLLVAIFPDQLAFAITFVGTACAVFYHRADERARRTSHLLRLRLERARLDALRSQMQPHFLFNAFNTVSALIHEDPARADRVLARLGDLLRMALRGASGDVVPLQEEMDFTDAYLDVERARFAGSLLVEVRADERARACLVPPFLLQPLVENAVRHGIAPAARAGRIRIRAALSEDGATLGLEVADDGVGTGLAGRASSGGLGLGNLRARLRRLYGDRAAVRVRSARGRGTRVRVTLPARTAGSPPLPAGRP